MLFHITESALWQATQLSAATVSAADRTYRPASLEREGFIHLSKKMQIVETANRFYRGQRGLLLLGIDLARLQADLRYDDVPGHGTFPHLYGPLNLDAVVKVWPFSPQGDGTFALLPDI